MYSKEDLLPIDMRGVWKAMEECHSLGLVKSIGVSNLSTKKLSDLLSYSTIPPAVNQVIYLFIYPSIYLFIWCLVNVWIANYLPFQPHYKNFFISLYIARHPKWLVMELVTHFCSHMYNTIFFYGIASILFFLFLNKSLP